MAEGPPEGGQFGQRRPPLSVTIKQILERYPDGQIFKEMIQNADDAGAKKVQFFVDRRTHDSSHVLLPALANYQGPALLSANDAVFTEQDWEGIQNLQQSGKAGDPFKVGRFGIGFNSVYHITDVPAIISSDRIVYLDPQEKLWPGQSGRYFKLSDDRTRQCLTSFHGIADFDIRTSNYFQQTLFRFPLRNAESDLSETIYTLTKILELIDALKAEAKLLLVFLRSVTCIEVFEINDHGCHTKLFETKITDEFEKELTRKRLELVNDVKRSHQHKNYKISSIHSFIARFDVSTYNQGNGSETVRWLVANQVGSSNAAVLAASIKQKNFPWVGAALELENASNGRIFCFLPMPIDTSSNLPVHVNGTFGLTDDRRSLKWPSVERRNDDTADWNTQLVTKVLPFCYASLLLEAQKYLSLNQYYKVWPDVAKLQATHWEGVLKVFFAILFQNSVIWCDNQRQWLPYKDVVYIPQAGLTDVVKKVLSSCGVKLANITSCVRRAFKFHGIKKIVEVNPSYVRNTLRKKKNCLRSLTYQEKIELLQYCWSDGNYNDFNQIELLPLANGIFVCFQQYMSKIYLCSTEYPRDLLPNINHMLVDISGDAEVQTGLRSIANTGQTQLTNLDVHKFAQLIDECMPANWRDASFVKYPWHENFPGDWFRKFWKWVSNKQLSEFANKLIVPTLLAGQSAPSQFTVVRLQKKGTSLYFPLHSTVSPEILSSLQNFGICCALQASFPFLCHSHLSTYIESFSGRSFLNCLSRCNNLKNTTLSSAEANSLLNLLSTVVSDSDLGILSSIKMFTSAANTSGNLFSIDEISHQSLLRSAVIEPPNLAELVKVLPDSVILLSTSNYVQTQLLSRLGITQQTDSVFVQKYIIPAIRSKDIGDLYIDNIMQCILSNHDMLRRQNNTITNSIQNLRFVKDTANVRKCPTELYNPNSTELAELYQGEHVFPANIYNNYIQVLLQCGLKNTVKTQEILNIIISISTKASQLPQPVSTGNVARAKAVLKYIQTYQFKQQIGGSYAVKRSIACGSYPFDKALLLITQSRNWLPVCSQAPPNYPSCLAWKGAGYTSHVMSLQNDNACVTCSSKKALLYTYGSQVFFSDPPVDSDVYQWLGSPEPTMHLCPHFFEVISVKDQIQSDVLLDIVCKVYSVMMGILKSGNKHFLNSLNFIKEWIYIQKYKNFVGVNTVACQENPNFRHSVDPYLHILPDSIEKYSSLFSTFGMNQSITRSQIISILESIHDQISHNTCSSDSGQVWNMVMAILNWLTNNGTEHFSDESILIPAESSSEYPDLKMSDTLVYTDNDFLRTFISTSDTDLDFHFVHSRVSPSLSKCLGVTPLSEEMDVSEDTFSDAGQYEPLTVRLKNILKDYKDGVTIIKELIQNADDAEATEINICYDARNHDIDHKCLFFPGMKDSHGPALIVHNNKTFSDDDFENIQKLAAATKAKKHLKIGKFGIGFCSVYHITDVPSFISRDRMYIFDPTLKHIGKEEVKNPAQPGKRVMFLNNVIQRSFQMAPFENMFNFDKSASYEGTMFRLPFRSCPSELSSTCYTHSHFNQLLEGIKESGEKLLIFLQHVQKITVQIIDTSDTQPNIVYQISKTSTGNINIDRKYFTTAVEITREYANDTARKSTWLIASTSCINNNKDAVASVACELSQNLDYHTAYTIDPNFEGEMFCFLPLSLDTGLPVHVSGNFAVINNRRGIWTTAESTTRSDPEVQWNVFLMTKVIPTAYINLLLSLRDMHKESKLQGYKFYHVWPLLEHIQMRNPWETFVTAFYSSLYSEELFYSENIVCWMNRSSCKLLLDNILCSNGILDSVVNVLDQLDLPITQLPNQYFRHVPVTPIDVNERNFVEVFFENIEDLFEEDISESRNDVLKRMLETYADYKSNSETLVVLNQHFQTCACIPCRPEGSIFRKCSELVYPNAPFAALFDECDHRFPIPLLVKNSMTVEGLKKGGMLHQSLPWNLVLERAQSISALYAEDKEKALTRVSTLLNIICEHSDKCNSCLKPELHTIAFLPVLRKPDDYQLKWAGDDSIDLRCGQDLALSSYSWSSIQNPLIAGSQICFVNESFPASGGCKRISEKAKENLHFQATPTVQNVVNHLKLLSKMAGEIEDKDWITKSCTMIYEFLNNCSDNTDNLNVILQMKTFPSLWNENKFINTTEVAKNWRQRFGPFLYAVPEIIVSRHNLLSKLSIKEDFSIEDVIKTLNQMKIKFQDGPVDNESEELLTDILTVFTKSLSNSDCKHLIESSTIYLPDEDLILYKSKELAYHDAGWAPKDSEYKYVHKNITRDIAVKLGVRLVRSKLLDPFVSEKTLYFSGTEFGQREELTRRIQNIIRDYPYDITLLKELLQNADDAKATKLYFILDKRTHGTESLISENWQRLQGPALLIWNDSVFTEKDLQGIQELGLGSKRSEAETIGQYGIGFNVVYHLTDCPSFVTGGETLCIMDPHCAYADGATPLCPGRRYDNLSGKGFWNQFSDMSSSYLISGLDNLPEELHHGSLFRFPLRHSEELVKASKILDHANDIPIPMSAQSLDRDLNKWISDLKSAMFFLNNVKEIKYMVINKESVSASTRCHYTRSIPEFEKFQGLVTKFQTAVSNFKVGSSCQSVTTLYPLTIKDHMETNNVEEKWLIQQGIGDITNHGVRWQYIKTVKPKHGIAAPLKVSLDTLKKPKQLFCFLPLPKESGVPVHVNGSFILDSTRRDLWTSTTPGEVDDKTRWNLSLFEAIAASYSDFLKNSKSFFMKESYQNWKTALDDLRLYCKMYPCNEISTLEASKKIRNLFKILVDTNASVLCVFLSKKRTGLQHISTEWYSLNSSNKKNQVYFWGITENRKTIHPILEIFGMNITSMDNVIRDILNASISDSEKKIPSVSPESVFQYYTTHSCCSTNNGMMPTHISNTVFENMETFLLLVKFLLKVPEKTTESQVNVMSMIMRFTRQESTSSYEGLFPGNPFSHFLLVSADNVLKQFDQTSKLLSSDYCNLFSNDSDKFLHLSLRELHMNKTYFILELSEEENKQYATNLVLQVFKNALPSVLTENSVIARASSVIDKNELFKYWDVIIKDSVIRSYLPHILQHLAILLTTDDKLYSLNSAITPMYLPRGEFSDEAKKVIEVLKNLQLPFLDESVVRVKVSCPHLIDNIDKVLQNILCVNKIQPLTLILEKNDINILINFLGKHSTPQMCMDSLKSLPLFENVTGEYQSILHHNTYIWPNSCSNGYSSWIAGHNVIFLKSDAHWTQLGSAQQFSMSQISEEGLYNRFIFPHPHFALMCEKDRYAHLEYIRDTFFIMIQSCQQRPTEKKSDSESQKIYEARTFYNSLLSLHCIGPTNSSLLPISAFCDHKKMIFRVFSSVFKTLPDVLKGDSWLQFFKLLNLKQLLSEQEYIDLCHKTEYREVDNITEVSNVLVEYLRDDGHTYSDYSFGVISTIPFVCSKKPLEVDWVMPGLAQSNQLVPMKGSGLLNIQHQLWTVRPLITLPRYTKEMMKKLGVVYEASDADIISNIINISKTPYSEEHLFTNYPPELKVPSKTHTVCNLINIMRKNFQCLRPDSDCTDLQQIPCIPVNIDLYRQDGVQVALVKPCSVIKFGVEVHKFHPYLYKLPTELSHIVIQEKLGISSDITIKHMQIVLEKVFLRCNGKEIIANIDKVVKLALLNLESQLGCITTDSSYNEASKALNPLYLPDVNKTLRLSTSLLYRDDFSYGRMDLDLKDTPFHYLDFTKLNYGILTTEFCYLIPESVRPIGISHQCVKVLDESCEEAPSSPLASLIQASLIENSLSENLTQAITHYVSERKKKESILRNISPIFESMKVKTIKNLQAHIKMKSTGKTLGHVKTNYIFDGSNCLYLDSKLRPLREHATGKISKRVIKAVRPLLKGTLKPDLEKKLLSFINDFLKASPQEKYEMLENINVVGAIDTFSFDTLGAEIPRILHDRLDQDANNIYNPMEIVGYESEEDKIIVAQIVYLVPSDHEQSVFLNKYKIYISDDDEEGIEVSILKLYKFLEGDKKPPVNSSCVRDESESVVLHDGGNQLTQLRASYHQQSAASKRRLICSQLREIWKLPENLRRSAIRRLYLHYHPDRNLDNVKEYESLFQFLQAQIFHLERNEPLDDPDDEASLGRSRSRPHNTNTSWSRDFNDWNATANSHRRYRDFHERGNSQSQFHTPFSRSEEDIDRRDPSEGRRWIRQAENEMTVLRSCLLQANDTEGYAHVCFLSHEVAEKALKGGLYALCGLDARKIDSHQLSNNAHALRTLRPHEARHLPDHCIPLEDHYLNTRFPNRWPGHTDSPCDHYHIQDAEDATQHAEEILKIVTSIMP